MSSEESMHLGEEARMMLSHILDPASRGKIAWSWNAIVDQVEAYTTWRRQLCSLLSLDSSMASLVEVEATVERLTKERMRVDTEGLLATEARRKLCGILVNRPLDDSLSWADINDAVTELKQEHSKNQQGLVDLEVLLEVEAGSSWHIILRKVQDQINRHIDYKEYIRSLRRRLSDILVGPTEEASSWTIIEVQARSLKSRGKERELIVIKEALGMASEDTWEKVLQRVVEIQAEVKSARTTLAELPARTGRPQ